MADLLTRVEPKTLRPHQVRAIEMLRGSAAKGNTRVVISAPTGFGKTLTASRIIRGALDKGNRVIFTAPAISLIDQTVEEFEAEGIDCIGVMQASHPRTDRSQPVQVASVQTLARREIPEAALVIVDECHIRSEVVTRLIREREDVFFVGLSATPWAKGMGLLWQDMVIPTTISELIEKGYLSKFRVLAPDVPDMTGVQVSRGDFVEEHVEKIMSGAALVSSVVETWLARGEARPTLCFAVNRAHARVLADEFEAAGVATAYVDAFTDMIERKRIERLFRAGEIKVVCSVRTLTTGVDWPVSCIIDAAPTKSEILHVQKIGRGLRVNPGTEDCLILDHAGNSLRLGLVTDIGMPVLDRTEKGPAERRPRAASTPKPCSACGFLHTGLTCPSCGHVRRVKPGVDVLDGELVEIGPRGGRKAPTREDKQKFWSMALWLDQQRNRGRRLAYALYKAKFGVWPRMLDDTPIPPDQAFLNYEKSRRIAYAKSKRGAA